MRMSALTRPWTCTALGMLHMLRLSPVRLYCMAVHGSQNPGRATRDLQARGSTQNLPSPPVLDFDVEKRRRRLVRHFESINARNPPFHLHCFDPNTLPGT